MSIAEVDLRIEAAHIAANLLSGKGYPPNLNTLAARTSELANLILPYIRDGQPIQKNPAHDGIEGNGGGAQRNGKQKPLPKGNGFRHQ